MVHQQAAGVPFGAGKTFVQAVATHQVVQSRATRLIAERPVAVPWSPRLNPRQSEDSTASELLGTEAAVPRVSAGLA